MSAEQAAENARRCQVVATDTPSVWKDGDEWICDQNTVCLTCGERNFTVLGLAATWDGAMSAARDGLPATPAATSGDA